MGANPGTAWPLKTKLADFSDLLVEDTSKIVTHSEAISWVRRVGRLDSHVLHCEDNTRMTWGVAAPLLRGHCRYHEYDRATGIQTSYSIRVQSRRRQGF